MTMGLCFDFYMSRWLGDETIAGFGAEPLRLEFQGSMALIFGEATKLSGKLLVKIDVASEGRNRAMKLTRVYDRSTKDPALLRTTLQQTLPPADE